MSDSGNTAVPLPPEQGNKQNVLRDRIAAAITSVRIQRDGDAYAMADAVIRELGLRRDPTSPYVATVLFGYEAEGMYRCVTDWMHDE